LPLPGKNPDEAELDDWKLRAARPSDGEAKGVILQRQPLDTVLIMAEVVDDVNHEKAAQQARDAVAADARKAAKRARRQARRAERLAARAEKKARGDGAEAGESAERRGQETRAEREERRGQETGAEQEEAPIHNGSKEDRAPINNGVYREKVTEDSATPPAWVAGCSR